MNKALDPKWECWQVLFVGESTPSFILHAECFENISVRLQHQEVGYYVEPCETFINWAQVKRVWPSHKACFANFCPIGKQNIKITQEELDKEREEKRYSK